MAEVEPAPKRVAPPLDVPQVTSFVAARRGERDEMQDTHALHDTLQVGALPAAVRYYAVFDGHGGRHAADHCARTLHSHLVARFPPTIAALDKDFKRAATDAFLETDREFLAHAAQANPPLRDGCVATVAVLIDNVVYFLNLGDSRVVLARRDPVTRLLAGRRLTKDHSPMDAAERKRIVAAGGVLLNGRVDGQLEVSRAFGDARFKHHGVTAKPDILRATLVPEQDVFLLLACDGLWKVFSPDEAVTFVDALLQPPIPTAALASTTSQAAVNALVNEAIHKGSTDNVTAVLVRLHWPGLETTSPAF